MTNVKEYAEDVPGMFASFPTLNVVEKIEQKYGIQIDTSLFADGECDVGDIKSYNFGMPNYFIEQKTDSPQTISISFYKFRQEDVLQISVELDVIENGKKVAKTSDSFTVPGWSPCLE